MKKITIFDTTLRDGEQSPGCSMHSSEKLEIAFQLERLGVDVIEAGFAISSKGDFNSIDEIASKLKNCSICSLARALETDIDYAYNSLKKAVDPRIHVFLATSPIHMKYKLKMSPEQVLERIDASVRYAKKYISNIQFSAEDAMRSESSFLLKAVNTAIKAGATTINLPDTVGYCCPEEIETVFKYIKQNMIGDAILAVHCHDDLGMAVAGSLAALKGGATQLECTVNGIGERAGNASLEEIVMSIKTREQFFDAYTNIDTKQIFKSSKLLSSITGIKIPPNKAIVGANAFSHESGIHQHGMLTNKETYEIMSPEDVGITQNNLVLGKHSGKHAFSDFLSSIGYDIRQEELNYLFEKFKDIAEKKKIVTHKDIESLITHTNIASIDKAYHLDSFGITSKKGGAVAVIVLSTDNGKISAESEGDGPVDAAFKAINSLLERNFKLEDYSVNAVTEGEDALGIANLRLSLDAVTMTGRGISTDIVEASISAYINACNKLLS